jgi:hypothetical protein
MAGVPGDGVREVPSFQPSFQIDDVRAVDVVIGVGHDVSGACGLCGQGYRTDWHLLLSVAHESSGGRTVSLCQRCAHDRWESLQARLAIVATMLTAADFVRGQQVG